MVQTDFRSRYALTTCKDVHIVLFNAVYDDVLAYGKTSQSRPQIFIAPFPNVRKLRQHEKSIRDGIEHTVRNFEIAAGGGQIAPNVVEFGLDVGR